MELLKKDSIIVMMTTEAGPVQINLGEVTFEKAREIVRGWIEKNELVENVLDNAAVLFHPGDVISWLVIPQSELEKRQRQQMLAMGGAAPRGRG